MPDFDKSLVQRLACRDIHDSNIKNEFDTLLSLADILPEKLVANVVRTFSHLRSGNTCRLMAIRQMLQLSENSERLRFGW